MYGSHGNCPFCNKVIYSVSDVSPMNAYDIVQRLIIDHAYDCVWIEIVMDQLDEYEKQKAKKIKNRCSDERVSEMLI